MRPRDDGLPAWLVPAMAASLLMLAIHAGLAISVARGDVAGAWPHFDGNTSVSRACRKEPAVHLFRALVLPSASLLALVWWLTASWFASRRLAGPRMRRWVLGLGLAGAVFLVLYATFLGTDGEVYRLMRRYGVYVFFGGTSIAQLLVTLVLRRDLRDARAAVREPAASPRLVRALTALMVFFVAAGPLNVVAAKVAGRDAVANVLEWWFAIAMAAALGLVAQAWRAEGLRLGLLAGGEPTSSRDQEIPSGISQRSDAPRQGLPTPDEDPT